MYAKDKTTIVDRREQLHVKLLSLAAESRIIRRKESRAFGQLRNELHEHRVGIVRFESRHTHIAYGLIRGKPYSAIEPTCITQPSWKRVRELIKKYGPKGFIEPEVMQGKV